MLMWTSPVLVASVVIAAFWIIPLSAIRLSVAGFVEMFLKFSGLAMVMLPAPVLLTLEEFVVLIVTFVPALMAV